jgi:hypothetical protein
MNSSEMIEFANTLYFRALAGERLILTGDSFFIGVIEKQLINKLATAMSSDYSLITYKPSLNAHFFSGGQLVVIDFFHGERGLHQLQFLDNLDEVVVLETKTGSAQSLITDYITPVSMQYDRVSFVTKEA